MIKQVSSDAAADAGRMSWSLGSADCAAPLQTQLNYMFFSAIQPGSEMLRKDPEPMFYTSALSGLQYHRLACGTNASTN